ncbi:dephospho-CoA kinase [Candidatus Koribacter versatilis Ellin345]|uniref:Dephospho-CoA kinase n=1 Tax=Koribacter versatilis (strain Ellin345) TaxID=204669 RepID=Q1II77_KORVE|nr:dephospho-CoA kinase [Candidatus Koribacter versatilis]ABF43423.1 dephospho-CoA kinase [Candidatus Koribacter versatilis Ellin345]
MLRVAITGGIATGKSTIGEMFARRGAHVIQADRVAHQLMSPGNDVYDKVVAHFGREILNPDGTINRPRLAQAAFPDKVQELNNLVHPAVLDFQDRWMDKIGEEDPNAIVICEAALLFEAKGEKRYDKIIVVRTPFDTKVQRYAAKMKQRLGDARMEVLRRMNAQMSEEEKARRADYVIDNNGVLDHTEEQVEKVWLDLQEQAKLARV